MRTLGLRWSAEVSPSQLSCFLVLTAGRISATSRCLPAPTLTYDNVLSSSSIIIVNSVSHRHASFARNPSSCAFRIQTLPTLEFETFHIQAPTKQYMAALSTIYSFVPPASFFVGPTRLPPFHIHLLELFASWSTLHFPC
jgi:hypothetical protein